MSIALTELQFWVATIQRICFAVCVDAQLILLNDNHRDEFPYKFCMEKTHEPEELRMLR